MRLVKQDIDPWVAPYGSIHWVMRSVMRGKLQFFKGLIQLHCQPIAIHLCNGTPSNRTHRCLLLCIDPFMYFVRPSASYASLFFCGSVWLKGIFSLENSLFRKDLEVLKFKKCFESSGKCSRKLLHQFFKIFLFLIQWLFFIEFV